MAPGDQSARVIRERDRGLLRAMGVTLLISACLVGGVLGLVGLRVNQVELSYRLEQLRQTRGQLEEVNRQLRVELATLRALARIESKARGELGMLSPSGSQVRMAREYVPGRAPDAASLRTAWEEPPAPPGPRAR
ncbi:MAG: cell division protein FtsL [Candidatus Rokubacteria bacterium]|nr:cell division protein FtsL [Candidatus Rokubacteria bacterium]